MKTKFTLLGGAALLALAGMGTATTVQAKEVWGKGAPEFTDPDGNIKFKVRGRLQMDYVNVDQDLFGTGSDLTSSQTRVRRARLGVEGAFDSKFKYKLEATFSGRNSGGGNSGLNGENASEVQLEDAYVEYVGSPLWSVVIGHQDMGYTLERLTSSRFSTNMERNLGDQAFNFQRTLGIGLVVGQDNWGGQLFLNGDSAQNPDLASGEEEWSVRAHGYWTPINTPDKLLYVGGTYRYRDAQNGANGVTKIQYRARPETNTGSRLADTGAFADADTLYSVEAAGKIGPFYAQGEYTLVQPDAFVGAGAARVDFEPEYSAYFVQAGWFLTGKSRPYKGGKFDRVTPNSPVSEGGWGAWELRARYDVLDLDDAGAAASALATAALDGGQVEATTLGVNWNPVKNVRFAGEYVSATVEERADTGSRLNGNSDVIQFRAQFDF